MFAVGSAPSVPLSVDGLLADLEERLGSVTDVGNGHGHEAELSLGLGVDVLVAKLVLAALHLGDGELELTVADWHVQTGENLRNLSRWGSRCTFQE